MKYLIAAFMLLACSGCSRDQPLLLEGPIKDISRNLDRIAPKLMDEYRVKGLSVSIIRNGDISLKKYFGYSDVENLTEINESTVFRGASLGKPIFAYIVVKLAQEGKIDLDKPLSTYLKGRVIPTDSRSDEVTARMVLSHSSGLPNLDVSAQDIEFHFSPSKEFKYSGHGYLYLQRVVEKITEKKLNKLAEEIVFKPLKMKESSFIWQSKYRETISNSYGADGEKNISNEKPDIGYSAWSLFTTLEDYSLFVSHIISTSADSNGVSALLVSPNISITKKIQWGLGWGLQNTEPNQSFWHWGSMAGFRHYVVGYPKEGLAVIFMSNSSTAFKLVDDVMVKSIGGSYPSYDWF